jgi:fatty acid desaturase
MFTNRRERIQCVISATLCLICAMVAFNLCDYSIYNFIKYYYIPIMCQGYWLVMITYLQHQDEDIEVFEDDRWSYVRGQMQTIDR